MAGTVPMPMKGLIAELEQRKLKPVPTVADKPKPTAVKPPISGTQNSPTVSPPVKLSTVAKPSTALSTPKEAATNGAPNKWNPVKTTTPVTPVQPQSSTSSVQSPGVAAVASPLAPNPALLKAGLKPTTTAASNETPTRPQPTGRGAGRGNQLQPVAPTKPTPGLKPGVACKPSSGGEQPTTSPAIKSPAVTSAAENETQAPPWVELVKKRNAAKNNGDVVGHGNDNKNEAKPSVAKQFSLSKTSETDKKPRPEASESQPIAVENGSSASNEIPSDDPEVTSGSGTEAETPAAASSSPLTSASQSTDARSGNAEDGVFTAGSKSYRRIALPAANGAAPPRKPAKPPSIDLSVYHRQVGADFDDQEELYDDAQGDIVRNETRPTSTVSRISEYTEEEEAGAARHWQQTAHEEDVADEIYDDVGDSYQDGEIYQELD